MTASLTPGRAAPPAGSWKFEHRGRCPVFHRDVRRQRTRDDRRQRTRDVRRQRTRG